MKAVVLHRTGGPEELVVETRPDPEPGPDEVLVRVAASAVCGRDLVDRSGGFPMLKLPTILGHEFAGEVVAIGANVADASDLRPGDRVVNLHRPACGACRRCAAGDATLCERAFQSFGHTIDGAYAELVVAHYAALVRLPQEIPFDVGSTLMCTAGVALFALRRRAQLALGESVVVTGASGGVGSAAVQIARAMGARVIAVTSSPAKEAALRVLGAHDVVVSEDGRFHGAVQRLTDGGADVALELTGRSTFTSALKSLRRGGRMVVVGNIDWGKVDVSLGALILYGYELFGSASCTRRDLEDVLDLVRNGSLRPAIARRMRLDEAKAAHRLLAERAVIGRIVLAP